MTIIQALLLLVGVILAYTIRNVREEFNEAKLIGYSVYNTFLVCIIALIVIYFQSGKVVVEFIMKVFALLVASTGTLVIMFGPKVLMVLKNPSNANAQPKKNIQMSVTSN